MQSAFRVSFQFELLIWVEYYEIHVHYFWWKKKEAAIASSSPPKVLTLSMRAALGAALGGMLDWSR